MDETQQVEDRLEDQIRWYSRKSRSNKNWYQRLRAVEIRAAASIPFLARDLMVFPGAFRTSPPFGLLIFPYSSAGRQLPYLS